MAKAKPAAKAGRVKSGKKGKLHELSAEGPQEGEQEPEGAIIMPLISSQFVDSEGSWWLLDPGAATSVCLTAMRACIVVRYMRTNVNVWHLKLWECLERRRRNDSSWHAVLVTCRTPLSRQPSWSP